MNVQDFDESIEISNEDALRHRLTTIRRGPYGAFFLSRRDDDAILIVHINEGFAYLHFFPAGQHPGFQPVHMTPPGCTEDVYFLQIDGTDGNSISMPPSTIVSTDAAITAACEFLKSPTLPPSISWTEL